MLLLRGQEGYDTGPGGFLADCFVGRQVGLRCIVGQEFTLLLEPLFYGLNHQPLVDASLARVTLVTTAVWFPLVLPGDPWQATLLDQPLPVVFGGVACSSYWFLMEVVLRVFVDLLKPGSGMFVDLKVVLVRSSLPCFGMLVMDGVGSIPLALSKVWLAARCIWGPLVLVDVQRGDAAKELFWQVLYQIAEALALSRIGPCFPHRAKLDNRVYRCQDILGQRGQSVEECSGFGLWSWWHTCDGAFADQGQQSRPGPSCHNSRVWHPRSPLRLARVEVEGAVPTSMTLEWQGLGIQPYAHNSSSGSWSRSAQGMGKGSWAWLWCHLQSHSMCLGVAGTLRR